MATINVPLTSGSNPDISTRLNNSSLFNLYVSGGAIYPLASLALIKSFHRAKAILRTDYGEGSFIIVTNDALYSYNDAGIILKLSELSLSGLPVRAKENGHNQIIIVDGTAAYVFELRNNLLTKLTDKNGFDLAFPTDVTVINTFTIIVSAEKWTVSDANNALLYGFNDVPILDPSMGKLNGCQELNNNLFIFGEFGVQRWVPSIVSTSALLPFRQDVSFRLGFGALSTYSIISNNSSIIFLSSDYTFKSISTSGIKSISTAGIGKKIKEYENINYSRGSAYIYNGQFFYQLTFPKSKYGWVYNYNSGTWSETDQLIIDSTDNKALIDSGICELTSKHLPRRYEIVSDVIKLPSKTDNYRYALKAVYLDFTQGEFYGEPPALAQYIDLSVSKDNIVQSNYVRRNIGAIGQTQATNIWRMNIVSHQFTFSFRYYGQLDLAFHGLTIEVE